MRDWEFLAYIYKHFLPEDLIKNPDIKERFDKIIHKVKTLEESRDVSGVNRRWIK